ncbi:hypothetical protein B0H34DRAFT_860832 [Crassisporium funariophilum]|nr:hypothetical protein B0H34DRAFT_860832 [Crassisporium funariophilum]
MSSVDGFDSNYSFLYLDSQAPYDYEHEYLFSAYPESLSLLSECEMHGSASEPCFQPVLSIPGHEPHQFVPELDYSFLHDQQSKTIPFPNEAAPMTAYSDFPQNDAFDLTDPNSQPTRNLRMMSIHSSDTTNLNEAASVTAYSDFPQNDAFDLTDPNSQPTRDLRMMSIDPPDATNLNVQLTRDVRMMSIHPSDVTVLNAQPTYDVRMVSIDPSKLFKVKREAQGGYMYSQNVDTRRRNPTVNVGTVERLCAGALLDQSMFQISR